MQFPLRTILLLPLFVGIVLGYYLFIERTRIIEWDTAGQFWGRFGRDCLLPVAATACIIGWYASLRSEDRLSFTHGLGRFLLWLAAFLVPFVAGLNPAIGVTGALNSRYAIRVFDVYSGILNFGSEPLDWITVGGHLTLTAILGVGAIWICSWLNAVNTPSQFTS